MKDTVLYINACVREKSRTELLAQHLLSKLEGTIVERKLEEQPCLPLNRRRLKEREAALAGRERDAACLREARQFAEADTIVVAAPFWDLSFPALLKEYLEAVCVQSVTFRYDETGRPQGLCRARHAYLVMTSGGPCFPDYGINYIRALFRQFFGIETFAAFTAENLDVWGSDVDAILQETRKRIDLEFA